MINECELVISTSCLGQQIPQPLADLDVRDVNHVNLPILPSRSLFGHGSEQCIELWIAGDQEQLLYHRCPIDLQTSKMLTTRR